jgi:hypothetical protein
MRLQDIPRRRTRLILVDVFLKLSRAANGIITPRTSAHADTVLVMMAVYYGHLTGSPLSANKIGLFLDMPRTTVLGRIKFLTKHNYIRQNGRACYVADDLLLRPRENLDRAKAMVLQAAAALSKSDT